MTIKFSSEELAGGGGEGGGEGPAIWVLLGRGGG